MAVLSLTNVVAYVGGANLTSYANQCELSAERDSLDKTTFGSSGYREFVGGLHQVTSSLSGFWDAGTGALPDDRFFTDLGVGGVPLSIAPDTADDGDLAFTTRVLRPSYTLGGQVGELMPYSSDAVGDGSPLVRGTILHPGATARTSTSTGTGRQLGAVASTQRLYAALHVLSVSGTSTPTLTVTIQSDDANTFSTPTSRISFTGATAIGGQFSSVAGAITDTWYRVSYTISGTNPSFTFAVVCGIATP